MCYGEFFILASRWRRVALALGALLIATSNWAVAEPPPIISLNTASDLVAAFNLGDDERIVNAVPNSRAASWIAHNAPRFDSPSPRLNEMYVFRWWSYRKHIKLTPAGMIVTEFLPPVHHAGPDNSLSCALGHQIAEGRWLRDQQFLDEYIRFWFHSGPDGGPAKHFHQFSGWTAEAIWRRACVTGDFAFAESLLDDLVADYGRWETERLGPDGLFWQYDVRDGMEESISGGRREKNLRPTINCYMAASARAIAAIADRAGRHSDAQTFAKKAEDLQRLIVAKLWDAQAEFFKVRLASGKLSDAREAIGFLPWTFGLAEPKHVVAWKQLNDPAGFSAPFGLTTAERRHPKFRTHGTGTCEWDGAVWPFATSQTLDALANLLRGPQQPYVTRRDYFDQLLRYADSQRQDGKPYIGEYLDETTGKWLIEGPKAERSRYYNHSTFCDLVIGGLAGIVPRSDDMLEVDPLVPANAWDWFCLDGVPYHGRSVSIVWDKTGEHFHRGAGLSVWIDGKEAGRAPTIQRLVVKLLEHSP